MALKINQSVSKDAQARTLLKDTFKGSPNPPSIQCA